MSGATSLAYVSMGSQVLGGLLGAKGSYDSAQASKTAYAIQAAVAQENARVSQEQARLALEAGTVNEQTVRLKTAGMFGAQRTAMAANGIDLGEGTATDILTTTKYMGERDALTVRDNAARAAWGYRVQANNQLNQASAYSVAGSAINPTMAAAGSLLSTAGSVAGSWYGMSKQGIKMPWEAGGGSYQVTNWSYE